jgi:hypothetical protein
VRAKWALYGVVPFILVVALQGMYFSGVLELQRLVCPKLPPLHPGAYREFGLLENAQNLLLLGILFVVISGLRRSVVPLQRLAFGLLALFTIFVLLEEIDYGTHIYRYFTTPDVAGWFEPATTPEFQALVSKTDFQSTPVNIHNRGDLTDIIKGVVSALMLGLFVVAPLLVERIKNPWIKYVIPDRFMIVTVAVMVLTRLIARGLEDLDRHFIDLAASQGKVREVGAMANNLSEFREFVTYYAFLVYLGVLVFCREAPVPRVATVAPEE